MIPVDQDQFGKDVGNCFSACLASLLELPLAEVPFMGGSDDWVHRTNVWLRRRGLTMVELPWGKFTWCHVGDVHVIATGKSPRGEWLHCIVGKLMCRKAGITVAFIHDPHPSREMIHDLQMVDLLVPLAPKASV